MDHSFCDTPFVCISCQISQVNLTTVSPSRTFPHPLLDKSTENVYAFGSLYQKGFLL